MVLIHRCYLFTFLALISNIICADSFFLGLQGGSIQVEDTRFKDSALLGTFLVGLDTENYVFEGGASKFGDIELKSSHDTVIKIEGLSFHILRKLQLSKFEFEAGAGALYWEADGFLTGRRVGRDIGRSLSITTRLRYKINEYISVFGGLQHIDDISSSDINLLQLGLRFSFN